MLHIVAILLFSLNVHAAKEPTVTKITFDNQPSEPQYFQGSETVLILDRNAGVIHRSVDAGTTWRPVEDAGEGEIMALYLNPNSDKVAIAIGITQEHYITRDQGKSWSRFRTELTPAVMGFPVAFHATDPDRIILNLRDWTSGASVYTTDGFRTVKPLKDKTVQCMWANERELFTSGDKSIDDNRALCVVQGRYSPKQTAYRLLVSDDYFETESEPRLEGERAATGIVSMVAVKGYILVAKQSEGTNEMALYVTTDTVKWSQAQFGQHKLEEDGYTIMESRNYSLQVDVMTGHPDAPMGMLFSSNSNGTYLTRSEDYTNRNRRGFVDFENLDHVQGIALVNTVHNWEAVQEKGAGKKIISQITFDDGRTYQGLKADGNKKLHLHSVTDASNNGRIFSSPAPGLVMGIGNTGDYLEDYNAGDLYVSDDGGESWSLSLKGAHKYEFGDQGSLLVAVYDEAESNRIMYSTDHGKRWEPLQLSDDNFKPQLLTTVPDSTGLKFLLLAVAGRGSDLTHLTFSIDFGTMAKDKCRDRDFEIWHARADEDGKATCLMGHTQSFRRRKANADCFIMEQFHVTEPIFDNKNCPCTDADFECDYGFQRSEDRKSCIPTGHLAAPEGACKNSKDTFKGPSGFRLIPGNECRRDKGISKDELVERPCGDTIKSPVSGKVSSEVTPFPMGAFREYFYLGAEASSGEDETVVMLSEDRELWISHDHGKIWRKELEDEEILAIYPNPWRKDEVYFLGPTKKVFYSRNRGRTMHSFDAPARPNNVGLQIMAFHPTNPEWLIWTSCADSGRQCDPIAHVTTKGGISWEPMLRGVENCEFVWREGRAASEQLVYCVQHANEERTGVKQLVSSEDWFEHKTVHFEDMLQFATMSEFIIAAVKDKDQNLKVDSSIDGKVFADARFPSNLNVPHQTAYTVLDSSTHSIFLHVTVNDAREQEYGSLIKSNSNGSSYALSLNAINRNLGGYVDFEKMLGLEGVATVNIVANPEQVTEGSAKKLKSMITHNDGADWDFIPPPDKDIEGHSFGCSGKALADCSLHLHGYTERRDARDTFSSASAVALMIGVGNVGEQLGRYKEGDTFISSDGGVLWRQAKKGQYMWEFGDQGSVIVIVEELTPTNVVYFSRDEGMTWAEFEFGSKKLMIEDITTVPSDTSRNFMLWGRDTSQRAQAVTVNLDFSGLTDKQCKLDETIPGSEESDYYLWEPKHPKQDDDNCLFGHVAQYHRKKTDRDCYNGPLIERLHNIARNCTCTRRDFEW